MVPIQSSGCRKIFAICVGVLACFTVAVPAHAQTERYELGKRLRRFEIAWQDASGDQRSASTAGMQKAVQSFFSLQLTTAARHLDDAYFVARSPVSPTDLERLVLSLHLDVQPKSLDASNASLKITLSPFYQLDVDPSVIAAWHDATFQLSLQDDTGQQRDQIVFKGKELAEGRTWPLRKLPEGDYLAALSVELSEKKIVLPKNQVSLIEDLSSRLEKVESWLKEQTQSRSLAGRVQRSDESKQADQSGPSNQSETIRLTVRQTAQTIRSQMDGRPLETDYSTARVLKLAEAVMKDDGKANTPLLSAAREGLGMTLSHNRRTLPVRVQLPGQAKNIASPELLPVVIAFHGAGGSENMFFETYGAGRLIKLATERGWMVVTPRHPLLGMPLNYREMLEVLGQFFPVDKDRVFLVGHSMGGAEVVRQVSLDPQPPRAAVVIGGGGIVKDTAAVRAMPWLVAAGELDFGRGGAKSLTARLKQLDCEVTYREYPSVEHMVIVQAALDDVFEFLDKR